jgi:hypothetical protein
MLTPPASGSAALRQGGPDGGLYAPQDRSLSQSMHGGTDFARITTEHQPSSALLCRNNLAAIDADED